MLAPMRRIPGAISMTGGLSEDDGRLAGLDAADAPVRDATAIEVRLDGAEASRVDGGQQPARGLRVVGQRDQLGGDAVEADLDRRGVPHWRIGRVEAGEPAVMLG